MSHDLIVFVQRTKASARLWHPFAVAAVFVLLTGWATVEKYSLTHPPEPEATYDFPVYPETCGTPTRIALTPFAVAGDTVMVGLVSAVVGFLLWVQMGGPACY